MSGRANRRLAWGLAASVLLLLVAAEVLALATENGTNPGRDVFIWAIALVFSVVGALIASRHPDNAIGWLFLWAGVTAGIGSLAASYADYWVDNRDGPALLGKTAAWYGDLSWIPWILVPSTFLLLLFPDGRLLSRRWRAVAWCAATAIAGLFVTQGLHAGQISDYPQVRNPYGVESPLLDPLVGLAFVLMLVGIVGSVASLILRFRRARGEQRQQIKWLAFAGAVAGACVIVFTALYDVVGEDVANAAMMLSVLGLPVAAGVAILRYRLYDIDVVINRTLVYGALTATLAAAYLACVLLLQLLLNGITGDSGLAVAGSTLAVAALFRPARARIQGAVDRRFYRRKYDAAQTLERFGAQLRDEVDLGALRAELRSVVAETMQPAHVSVWLRSPRGEV
jgi:uncharacterized membrane protein YeaQ/YmgE (transglycosylase-associated protein family)